MRRALLVLLISSTAHAGPPRVTAYTRYVAQTESVPLVSWLPSSIGSHHRMTDHLSLMVDWEFSRSEVAESQWTSSTRTVSAQARRVFLATNVGVLGHVGDHAYGMAGVGWVLEGLQTRLSSDSDWDDGDGTWRPRAFIGSGVAFRRGHLGVAFEARAVALGGSGPKPTDQMSMIATPEISHFALQASAALVFLRP